MFKCSGLCVPGSLTLHQWQSLATPNLGGILKPRPGIQIKGEVGLDVFEEDPYSLSDYEEDGKRLQFLFAFQTIYLCENLRYF